MSHRRRNLSALALLIVVVALVHTASANPVLATLPWITGSVQYITNNGAAAILIVGVCFTAPVSGTIAEVDFFIGGSSTIVGTLRAQIYSTTGVMANSPAAGTGCASLASFLGNSTTTIAPPVIQTPSQEPFIFNNGPTVVANQKYIVALAGSFTQAGSASIFFGDNNGVNTPAGMAHVDNFGGSPQGALAQNNNDVDEFTCTGPSSSCESFNVFLTNPQQPTQPTTGPSPYGPNPIVYPCCQQVNPQQLQGSALRAPDVDVLPLELLFIVLFLLTLGSYLVFRAVQKQRSNPRQYEIAL